MVHGIPERYLLRWRFTYSDHKPDKYGIWLDSGGPETMAAYTDKTNLHCAMIEGKDLVTKKNKVLWEIPGHEFKEFQFLGAVSVNPLGFKGTVKIKPQILGARLLTSGKMTTVFISGRVKHEDPPGQGGRSA
jgi:hypothetical protein